MTRRLTPHWLALHKHLGRDPWRAGEWTLDETLVIETFAEDHAREQRVNAAMRRGR